MGKVAKRVSSLLVPPEPDRHANKIDIYKTKGGKYHVNIRSMQIRMSEEEFQYWKKGLNRAKEKLGDLMKYDQFTLWEGE